MSKGEFVWPLMCPQCGEQEHLSVGFSPMSMKLHAYCNPCKAIIGTWELKEIPTELRDKIENKQ